MERRGYRVSSYTDRRETLAPDEAGFEMTNVVGGYYVQRGIHKLVASSKRRMTKLYIWRGD